MKNKFSKKINWIPLTLAMTIVAVSLFGLIRLYSIGEEAVEQKSTLAEKRKMSTAINPSKPYDDNVEVSNAYQAFGTVYTSDGRVLYSPTVRSAGVAFYNLIGDIEQDSDIYVASSYKEELSNDYSWWNGLKKTEDHDVVLTINADLQEKIYAYMTEHNIKGSVLAYNYKSGEILCMASTPGVDITEIKDMNLIEKGSLLNKNLYTAIPGSTMKVVTTLLAMNQGMDVANTYYTCEGTYHLQSGGTVTCMGSHGSINGQTALAVSCNSYFAQVAENLDLAKVTEDLRSMGFVINSDKENGCLGNLNCMKSSTRISETPNYNTVWSLIGQGSTAVNPLDMVKVAAAIADAQQTVEPRILMSDATVENTILSSLDVAGVDSLWEAAYSENYSKDIYGEYITAAKTGTAQLGNGMESKLLIGYSKELHTSFYIVYENYVNSRGITLDVIPGELAKVLLEDIAEIYGKE